MIKVQAVEAGGLAALMGLKPGVELLTINDIELEDFLDWEFLSAEEEFKLAVQELDGSLVEYDIERSLDEPLGVVLEPPRIRRCANRCDFCFVDGLPEGLREVLYIRDDDYRLSFRYGNFATLTNLKPKDTQRIIDYRLSPLYVSVHATDPAVRRYLLRNPTAPDILDQLKTFAAHGIEFHTQIVFSPGVNDGEVLGGTLQDLWNFGPAILSVSVVPVGLTEFSKHHLVREPNAVECQEAITQLEALWPVAKQTRNTYWVWGADELYLRAGRELPAADVYGDFEQVENGVGSVRYLQQRVAHGKSNIDLWQGKRLGVLTGTSMGRLLPQVVQGLESFTAATFEVQPLSNSLFGESVTTAGLLPGRDFLASLSSQRNWDAALLPAESLNDNNLFMDGLSAEEVIARSPIPVYFSRDFVDVLGGDRE